MAGIAVSASTGVMNPLLSKLSILLSDQYKQLKGGPQGYRVPQP